MRDRQDAGVSTTPLATVADARAPIVYGIVQPGPEIPGGVPFVQSRDVGGAVDVSALNRTSQQIAEQYRRSKIAPGDILFSLRGNIGQSSMTPAVLDGANIARGVARIRVGAKGDPEFVRYVLQGPVLQRLIARNANGSTFRELSIEEIRKLPIPDVSLPEQRKIAEILRTWDEALEMLTALRAAKARRLAGVGRALLDRAADASATVTKPLATLTRIVKGQQLNKLDISEGQYPVWNGGVTPSGFHNTWSTEGSTITISEGGNSCGFVNLAEARFWLGGHCYALQDLSQVIERDFLFHALKSREPEIMRLRVGSGLPNIQRADLERLPVVVPPQDLQQKIARALNAGNAELALLEAEIEALTRQKRGLMQKLLTGEWRLEPDKLHEVAR